PKKIKPALSPSSTNSIRLPRRSPKVYPAKLSCANSSTSIIAICCLAFPNPRQVEVSYAPPFTITTDILNLVAEISEQVGELNASQLNASPQLRKQNRIKTITGTLAIEGNTLTEEQITAIVEGKPVLGSVRELAEVKGAIAAYEALPDFTPANLDHLCAAHGLMMAEVLVEAGAFRTKGVGI